MKRNLMKIKDVVETVLAVVMPSVMMGLLVAMGLFIAMGWDIIEETYSRFSIVMLVSSLAFAIYFSVKATIYMMEQKYMRANKKQKKAEIIPFGKNPKLFEGKSRIS